MTQDRLRSLSSIVTVLALHLAAIGAGARPAAAAPPPNPLLGVAKRVETRTATPQAATAFRADLNRQFQQTLDAVLGPLAAGYDEISPLAKEPFEAAVDDLLADMPNAGPAQEIAIFTATIGDLVGAISIYVQNETGTGTTVATLPPGHPCAALENAVVYEAGRCEDAWDAFMACADGQDQGGIDLGNCNSEWNAISAAGDRWNAAVARFNSCMDAN